MSFVLHVGDNVEVIGIDISPEYVALANGRINGTVTNENQ